MAATPKTVRTGKSVKAFLDTVDDETQRRDAHELSRLMAEASGKKAEMWGPAIVGFGATISVGASGKGVEWPAIAFSPRKAATALYGLRAFSGREALLAKLGKYKKGGGCVYIKRLDAVHLPTLKKLLAGAYKAAHSAT